MTALTLPCEGSGQVGQEHGLVGAICLGCNVWRPVDSTGRVAAHDRELTASEALDRHVRQRDTASGALR